MDSILDQLPPATIETLISWCEDHPYTRVKELAAQPLTSGGLDLRLSKSTLCRLYSTHNIADTKETRAAYAAQLGLASRQLRLNAASQENLELRLLEITAKPNPTVAELRLAAQYLQRQTALQLAQRRVQVTEKREARITRENTPPKPQTPEEADRAIHILLGKDFYAQAPKPSSNATPHHPSTAPAAAPNPPNPPSTADEPSLQLQIVNNQSSIVNDDAKTPNPSEMSSLRPDPEFPSATNQNPIPPPASTATVLQIPAHIQAHADRNYPLALRPKDPIWATRYDWAREHCIQSRLRIESQTSDATPNASPIPCTLPT